MISDELRSIRQKRGFVTIKAMADALEINPSTLSDWESGRKQPSKRSLKMLREKLGLDLSRLSSPSLLDLREPEDPLRPEPAAKAAATDISFPVGSQSEKPSGDPKKVAGGQNVSSDPLDSDASSSLLVRVDVIRDPLHGDIRLTALERHLIDSAPFQRLRNINQLSPTYIVYPGALHTRFLHSLGTLHVCSEMIATCNANAETYARLAPPDHPVPHIIAPYAQLLARLCALLHDTAHVPFGHTFEKEGKLFANDEWCDHARVERLFGTQGQGGELSRSVVDYFRRAQLPLDAAEALCNEIRATLVAKRSEVSKLRYPFVHDIVGNTICADLIDYVQRDSLFCGLTETFGKRFLSYLAVIPTVSIDDSEKVEGISFVPDVERSEFANPRKVAEGRVRSSRLVLMQYRYNERRELVQKHDVIAEAIDLVRRRLNVAEKLYFHRTKVVASSMLIDAAQAHKVTPDEIWDQSDAEVVRMLATSPVPRASRLAGNVRRRHLYKPIFRASYHMPDESGASEGLWNENHGVYARFSDPKIRAELAADLDRLIGTIWGGGEPRPGSATVYCPEREMNEKRFHMLVLTRPDGRIRPLEATEHPPSKTEIKAIKDTHRHLWKIEVFVDPDIVPLDAPDPEVQKLAGAIQHCIGVPNEIDAFKSVPTFNLAEWQTEITLELDLKSLNVYDQIRKPDFDTLRSVSYSDGYASIDVSQRRERLRARLEELGYTFSS